ncbi:hypothetical protein [Niabella drilacis]|uniref:Outer membrane protein beta-barrel domain-containing protein n=1 Tax=Niabella drilacis (strain DSM 25811 / CCM 8410 / CCUG 62505 / LMG 26954 / E90) TaxID=1285928 RepID=A0A1G6V5K2_NIADE|nr:hypothetical protein [Niabella drilacis]SDD48761.1 hypothetical protein SAMN04487894_109198 [Niabella drilacis]
MRTSKTVFCLLLLFLVYTGYGQVHWFIRPEGNFSLIRKTGNTGAYDVIIDNQPTRATITAGSAFNNKWGAGLSGGFMIPTAVKRLLLEAAAGVVMTNDRVRTTLRFISPGDPTRLEMPGARHITMEFDGYAGGFPEVVPSGNPVQSTAPGCVSQVYTQLNIGAKYHIFKKTALGLGVSPYLLVNSSGSRENYRTAGFAGQAKTEQMLNDRFALQASFTHHFSKTYKEQPYDVPGRKPKMQYASLGLSYYFN